MKKIIFVIVLVLAIASAVLFFHRKAAAPTPANKPTTSNSVASSPSTQASFNKQLYPTNKPDSLWVVVNKPNALQPTDYVPSDLIVPDVPLRLSRSEEQMHIRKLVEQPMKELFSAAKQAGFQLSLGSGYRSYAYQKQLYDGYVLSSGQAEADKTSARPGHSEHQTGLAFDVEITNMKCHLDKCLGDTPDGKWIAENAYKYGFIVRYTADKTAVTGYDYEPWHLRYVGTALAIQLHNSGIKTLEEFFNIAGGPNY